MRRTLAFTWLQTLVWLLALALPLQAQARVSMLGCAAAPTPPAHHQMADTAQLHHHAGGDEQQQHHAAHQCSACAVCCIGAALPSQAPALARPAGGAPLAEAPEPASLGVVTALLERPPRPLLA